VIWIATVAVTCPVGCDSPVVLSCTYSSRVAADRADQVSGRRSVPVNGYPVNCDEVLTANAAVFRRRRIAALSYGS
jgi:hypothetical protein